MGVFWDKIRKMRENSRPFTQKKASNPAKATETAKNELFAPVPNKEVGENQKAVKKAKKRKETAVSEDDGTAD